MLTALGKHPRTCRTLGHKRAIPARVGVGYTGCHPRPTPSYLTFLLLFPLLPLLSAAAIALVVDALAMDLRLIAMPFTRSMKVRVTPTTINTAKASPEVCAHGGRQRSSKDRYDEREKAFPGG
eukprot:scaffold311396_cov40-Tisochrysis_lutea.AAC.2